MNFHLLIVQVYDEYSIKQNVLLRNKLINETIKQLWYIHPIKDRLIFFIRLNNKNKLTIKL